MVKSASIVISKPQQGFDLGDTKTKDCVVTEIASGESKPCESVFIFEGVTYNGCTIEGSNDGKAWCSTKVDPISWEHVGNDFYGNCPNDGSCLTDEQGKEELQTLIEAECKAFKIVSREALKNVMYCHL